MDKQELISVIIPIYNVEKYIDRCLKSLMEQTYKNLEIILIDDGSIDNSGKICDEYAKKDKRIIVTHQKNSGVSNARNRGLELAQGAYIGFVDPDDFIELNMYEEMMKNIVEQNCAISVCGVRNIEEWTGKIIEETNSKQEHKINVEQFFQSILNGKNMTTSVWNKLFDRAIIKNIYFDEQMKIGEDFKWIFEILKNNTNIQIYNSNKILYNWVKRKESAIQGKKFDKNMQKNLLLSYEIKEYIVNKYPNIYSYALKNCLLSNILSFEKMDNKNEKKQLKVEINRLIKEFVKLKDISRKEKIKLLLRYKNKKMYTFMKTYTTKENSISKSNLYDMIKIVCLLLVVIGHITKMYTSSAAFFNHNNNIILEYITKFIYTFQMPCFMLISGCIFGLCIENGKYQNNFKFVLNKFKRLILPYLGFGLVYVAPILVLLKITDMNYVEYVYNGIIKSLDCRHLWYLLSLFLIFLTTIFTKNIYTRKKGYLLLIINFALIFLGDFVTPLFQLQISIYYQLYFYMGFVLNKYIESFIKIIKSNKIKYLISLIIILLTKAVVFESKILDVFYALIGIIFIITIAILVLQKTSFKNKKIYKLLNENSFGIYLFHPMIIYVIYYIINMTNIKIILVMEIVLSFIITMILSIFFTKLLRKTKLRVFIGEGLTLKNKKNKKVYINAYLYKNLGDDLFVKILAERYPNIQFYAYSTRKYTKTLSNNLKIYSGFLIRVIRKLSVVVLKKDIIKNTIEGKCDISITIGGSLFVENRMNYKDEIERVYNMEKENYMIGLNFGPYKTQQYYKYVREKIISKAKYVCFRDNYSYKLFSDLSNVGIGADIIFSLNKENIKINNEKSVVFSVMDCDRGIGSEYKKDYENKIKILTEKYIKEGYKIKFIAFCISDGDKKAIKSIIHKIDKNLHNNIKTFYYNGNNMSKILNEIAKSEIVVGTRFHANVIGLLFKKRVIPISYNIKTINVLTDINFCGDIYKIQEIQNLNIDKINIDKQICNDKEIERCIIESEEHFKELDKILI